MNKKRIAKIICFILILLLIIVSIFLIFKKRETSNLPVHTTKYTVFATNILDERYGRSLEEQDYFNYQTSYGKLNLYPRFSCYTDEEICILDNLNSRVLVFKLTNLKDNKVINTPDKIYAINMKSYEDYWIDRMVLVNNDKEKKFIGRIVKEVEFDNYVGKYVLITENNGVLDLEDLKINGQYQEDKPISLNDPLLFVKNKLVFPSNYTDEQLIFTLDSSNNDNNLASDSTYDLNNFLNYHTTIEEFWIFSHANIDSYINYNSDTKIFLNYSTDDRYWYIQKYNLAYD